MGEGRWKFLFDELLPEVRLLEILIFQKFKWTNIST